MRDKTHHKRQKGNVLFLILIAVALFAALSYTVTQTNRSPQSTISQDKAKLLAAEIIGYAASIEHAISSMTLINKVPDYSFDVSATNLSNSSTNATCSDEECSLFNTRGGNVSPKLLPRDAWDETNATMTDTWQGKVFFRSIRVAEIGSDEYDFMLLYPGVNEETCIAINERVGVANQADGSPPSNGNGVAGTNYENYTGTLTSFPVGSSPNVALGNTASEIIGKRTFCVQNGVAYYFWHTLLAR